MGRKKKREQRNVEMTPIDKWAMLWFVVTEKWDGFNTYGEKFLDE